MALVEFSDFTPQYDPDFLVFSGSSGTGKTSTAAEMTKREPSIQVVLSVTTRQKRVGDLLEEYLHVTSEEFERRKQAGEFAWTIEPPYGIKYGTLRASISQALGRPLSSIIFLTPQGAHNLAELVGQERVLCFYFEPLPETIRNNLLLQRGELKSVIEARFKEEEGWLRDIERSAVPFLRVRRQWKPRRKANRILSLLVSLKNTIKPFR